MTNSRIWCKIINALMADIKYPEFIPSFYKKLIFLICLGTP